MVFLYRVLARLGALFLLSAASASAASQILAVPAVFQQTPEYCWLASGEMIFRYYKIPQFPQSSTYQCGILQAANIACNPKLSAGALGPNPDMTLANEMSEYPMLVRRALGTGVPQLRSGFILRPLSYGEIKTSVRLGHPFIAGISPSAMIASPFPEHAVVVVGYDDTSVQGIPQENIIVNDPFPYGVPLWFQFGAPPTIVPDPYLLNGAIKIAPGQYEIPYRAFVLALKWGPTILAFP